MEKSELIQSYRCQSMTKTILILRFACVLSAVVLLFIFVLNQSANDIGSNLQFRKLLDENDIEYVSFTNSDPTNSPSFEPSIEPTHIRPPLTLRIPTLELSVEPSRITLPTLEPTEEPSRKPRYNLPTLYPTEEPSPIYHNTRHPSVLAPLMRLTFHPTEERDAITAIPTTVKNDNPVGFSVAQVKLHEYHRNSISIFYQF